MTFVWYDHHVNPWIQPWTLTLTWLEQIPLPQDRGMEGDGGGFGIVSQLSTHF